MRELINTIAHIGYQVSDLTRSLAFYEPLGFQRQQRFSKPSPQGTIEVAFLEMAGAVLELYLFAAPMANGSSSMPVNAKRQG